jgi:myosin XV
MFTNIFFWIIEWQPLHNKRQLVKVVGPIVEIQEQYALPNDIDQHAFSKFTNIYFKVIYISYNKLVKNSI